MIYKKHIKSDMLIKKQIIERLNMKKKLFIFLILFFFKSNLLANNEKDFSSQNLICPKLLWGFEFISNNRVKVIGTDLNNKTKVMEYNYDTDFELSFINIFQKENILRNRLYSIELNTLRVDIWTMTGGGFTTREMFPIGFCKLVKNRDISSIIESLKFSK